MSEKQIDFDRSFEAAVAYVSRMLDQAREIHGFPVALVISTPKGMMLMIDGSFPREAMPSADEWAAMRPGGDPAFELPVKPRV